MTLSPLWLPLLALAAQPESSSLPVAGLADTHVVDGVIESAFRIQAGESEYTLVLSRTGSFVAGANTDEHSARLYATLFLEQGDEGASQQWLIQDRVDDCPVDLTAQFSAPPVAVSDADDDGVPEIWVRYRLACRGDVSPSTLKVIGYEGSQKYALRGNTQIMLGDTVQGGDYQADPALEAAPALLKQARELWLEARDERS